MLAHFQQIGPGLFDIKVGQQDAVGSGAGGVGGEGLESVAQHGIEIAK